MKRAARTVFTLTAFAALTLACPANHARACPNCKEAVSLQPDEVGNLSSGYNWSVLFMLTVPFSMLGAGAFMVRRAVKRGVLPEM
jgi:hypothetical protein